MYPTPPETVPGPRFIRFRAYLNLFKPLLGCRVPVSPVKCKAVMQRRSLEKDPRIRFALNPAAKPGVMTSMLFSFA